MTSTPQDLRFYFHPQSRARMVRWMLEECEAAYEPIELAYGSSMKSAEYLQINPMGKVPCLVHGDTVVTESAAILTYLAELYPQQRLAPAAGSPARGSYYRWLFFLAGPVEAATTARAQGFLEHQTPEQAQTAGYGRFDDIVHTLSQAVSSGPYLCGDHFTAADLLMASFLQWCTKMGGLPARPEFTAYFEPLIQRPAALRAFAADDALLRGD